MFLSNLIVKSPITKKIIEINIFEGMSYRFVSKQYKHSFNVCFILKVEYKSQIQTKYNIKSIVCHSLKNIIIYLFLRWVVLLKGYLKKHRKNISALMRFVHAARGPERENKQCADILLTISYDIGRLG